MQKRIGILFFSPTGTTRKICLEVATGLNQMVGDARLVDITKPRERDRIVHGHADFVQNIDLLIVGSPVHSGKLPLPVIDCLKALEGNGKEAVAVVVYGNRDYGVALSTMAEMLAANGFQIKAAGTFIGQHSYSDIVPVALGRPDISDLEKARNFGEKCQRCQGVLDRVTIPSQLDKISQSPRYSALKPVHNDKLCIQCGKCAKRCPLGLLSSETGLCKNTASEKQCIGCMACVQACESHAKIAKTNFLIRWVMRKILKEALRERREPVMIFP